MSTSALIPGTSPAAPPWAAAVLLQAQVALRAAGDELEEIAIEVGALVARVAWQSRAADEFRESADAASVAARMLIADVEGSRDRVRAMQAQMGGGSG